MNRSFLNANRIKVASLILGYIQLGGARRISLVSRRAADLLAKMLQIYEMLRIRANLNRFQTVQKGPRHL